MDGSKLKSDVSKLNKAQDTFVLKTSIESMTKDVAKIKTDIGDLGFEVSAAKDLVKKSDKLIETNHKENK